MDLSHARLCGDQRRDHRIVKRSCRHDDVAGGQRFAGVGLRHEAPVGTARHLRDFNPGADRAAKACGIAFQIIGHFLLGRKAVGAGYGKGLIGKTVVPGRAIGHQRIPAPRSPMFGQACAFDHQVRSATPGQVRAGGDARLSAADDQRFNVFAVHGVPFPCVCRAEYTAPPGLGK